MNEEYTVEYFFTSGLSLKIYCNKEMLIKMCSDLKKSWKDSCVADESYGIYFGQVTHYIVGKNK
jgi:hypothetical protein